MIVNSGGQRRPNPYHDELALANSTYAAFQNDKLVAALDPSKPVAPVLEFIHDSFRALVLNPRFSCLAAKSALRRGSYRMGVYGEMGSVGATAGLTRDLFAFVEEQKDLDSDFATFAASFTGPNIGSEMSFESLLWAQLQALHNCDHYYHEWDPSVSSDPEHQQFSFSFAGRAFYIVGLHSASSRWTRRFAWPTLVFNAHDQFERLRQQGQYTRMKAVIRSREGELQGSVNPTLNDFGDLSEARQYSGRAVESEWSCPFHTHGEGELQV